jgi:kumamolisin
VASSLPLHNPKARIEVTLKLRTRPPDQAWKRRIEGLLRAPLNRRRYLTRAEHEIAFGCRTEDLVRVDAFAHRHGLTVVDCQHRKRTVRLAGSVEQIQQAFGVRLRSIRLRRATYHAHDEDLSLPRDLKDVVVAVFGLDTRPLVGAHLSRPPSADAPGANGGGLSPGLFTQLYRYPAPLDGSGQCLAIIEANSANNLGQLGTGYRREDLDAFFSGLGVATPSVTAISGSGGAGNLPGVNDEADAEAALDIQLAGCAAPGASLAVYFGLNSEQGFHDVVAAAIHDGLRNPRVVSMSWGLSEDEYSPGFMSAMNALFSEAATLGITVCASAGDLGSSGKERLAADGVPHPHFPASSPYILGCGGTTADIQGQAIVTEQVWNGGYAAGAGGGGVSDFFPRPDWQASSNVPLSPAKKWAGRGIPDLAAHADQAIGYRIVVNGGPQALGGTSAVAPLIAGLLARINQSRAAAGRGSLGFINPLLYQNADKFRDITEGNNDIDGTFGAYSAQVGWDACSGLGAPDGAALLRILG